VHPVVSHVPAAQQCMCHTDSCTVTENKRSDWNRLKGRTQRKEGSL
jgi:hypothetical protein